MRSKVTSNVKSKGSRNTEGGGREGAKSSLLEGTGVLTSNSQTQHNRDHIQTKIFRNIGRDSWSSTLHGDPKVDGEGEWHTFSSVAKPMHLWATPTKLIRSWNETKHPNKPDRQRLQTSQSEEITRMGGAQEDNGNALEKKKLYYKWSVTMKPINMYKKCQ